MIVNCIILIILTFAKSDVENLFGKPVLWVFKDGSCKLIHALSGLSTKLGFVDIAFIISNEFVPVNKDNLVVSKAKVGFEEFNSNFSSLFPVCVGTVDCVDYSLVSNQVILSFKE
jgi:hypothetical protein